jgi:hypothetical protein
VEKVTELARRGTSNKYVSGNSEDRRRRRAWLLTTYAADQVLVTPRGFKIQFPVPRRKIEMYQLVGDVVEDCCRCFRCGILLTIVTLTVDRIIPGCKGGTYRRDNIRPACGPCNSETGGSLAGKR